MPALPHPPLLSVYTILLKITCPPQNTLLYLNKNKTKRNGYERTINHGLGNVGNVGNPKRN